MANPQEHHLEHCRQAESGHKAECRRMKAEMKEAADAEAAAAELSRLRALGAAGPSRATGLSASGRGAGRSKS